MKACWSFLVRMSLALVEFLPNNSAPISNIRALKSPKLSTPPANPRFSAPRAWKVWAGAFGVALLLHGLLFYWLSALVPPPVPSPPLVVEFLDFSPNPPEEANDLEAPQIESAEKVAEEIPENVAPPSFENEPLLPELETDTAPQTEREIAETKPIPPPLEPPIVETQAEIFEKIEQEPPPDVSLNDLIQEEELEKLSMELRPPSQKSESPPPPAAPTQKQEEPPKSLASQSLQETPQGQAAANAPPIPSEKTFVAEPSSPEKISPDPIEPPQEARDSLPKAEEFPTVAMVAPKNEFPAPSSPAQKDVLPQNYFLKNPKKQESTAQKPLVEPTKNFSISSLLPQNFPALSQGNAGENSAVDSPFPQVPIGQNHSAGMSYGLNDYNWPYEPYMGRWAKALLYSWNNHPPRDYVTGRVLGGGTVFVLVTLDVEGALTSYEVTRVEGASAMMVTSVLNAIQGASNLPPLPADFEKEELTVHFKFIYPSLYHLLRRNR